MHSRPKSFLIFWSRNFQHRAYSFQEQNALFLFARAWKNRIEKQDVDWKK